MGLVLKSPEKITIEKSLRLGFSAINNEVKNEALLVGMAGSKNERKNSGGIFKFEAGCRPSEGRVGGQGYDNARIFKSG